MSPEIALIIAILMLLGNAFFVGAEFGLVSARRSSIELLALSGSKSAKISLHAMENVSQMLAGAQLGITLCSLVLGAVGEPLIAHALETPLEALGMSTAAIHIVSFAMALTIMVYLHVVIGEMVPKNLALAHPDKTALTLIPPLALLVKWIGPVVTFLNRIANKSLLLMGITPKTEITSAFNRDEVAGFVKESRHKGLIDHDEEQLLEGALGFDEQLVSSVLMPIGTIMTVSRQVTSTQIEQLVATTGYSRFPVMDANILVGYVHLKDILKIPDSEDSLPIPDSAIRPLLQIKSTYSLRHALMLMQRSSAHLAKVIGDNKEVLGVVALEDVLEELVGTISDDGSSNSNTKTK